MARSVWELATSAMASFDLSFMYGSGKGVKKDEKKQIFFLEEAAIGGHPEARYKLGYHEWESKRKDRAVKHWIIAAHLGHSRSIEILKVCYKGGLVTKEDFAAALRAQHAAVSAMKSPQREMAKAAWENYIRSR